MKTRLFMIYKSISLIIIAGSTPPEEGTVSGPWVSSCFPSSQVLLLFGKLVWFLLGSPSSLCVGQRVRVFNLLSGTGPSSLPPGPAMVLKVEVAHPVDDVKQQEGGGEKDARVCVQLQ